MQILQCSIFLYVWLAEVIYNLRIANVSDVIQTYLSSIRPLERVKSVPIVRSTLMYERAGLSLDKRSGKRSEILSMGLARAFKECSS